jgi:hypothetical protein
MKITIEPTHKGRGKDAHRTVTVECPHDDVNIDYALELVAAALKAYGYADESVNEAIPPR